MSFSCRTIRSEGDNVTSAGRGYMGRGRGRGRGRPPRVGRANKENESQDEPDGKSTVAVVEPLTSNADPIL